MNKKMPLLIGWCWIAGAVLIVSFIVHASTFFGSDPMTLWPGVMWIHGAIFPPFVAAIIYARWVGGKNPNHQETISKCAPRWLQKVTFAFFIYALVNFGLFAVLTEGGGPHEENGKFWITSHGRILRELSEAEYHRQRACVVRGFSGHWMLFSSAALMLLVGAANTQRRAARGDSTVASHSELPLTNVAVQPDKTAKVTELPPEPTTVRAGLSSMCVLLMCLAFIISGRPAIAVAAVPPVLTAMVLAMCRRRGFPYQNCESCIGCLAVFPCAFVAMQMGRLTAEFIYLVHYIGFDAALNHDVVVTFPKEGPAQLSNGDLLNNRVWSALMYFVQFPLFALGSVGLTYLAEQVGRLVEVRRQTDRSIKPT